MPVSKIGLRLEEAFMAGSFSMRTLVSKGHSRTHCKISSAPGLSRLSAAWLGRCLPALLVSALQAQC